MVFVIWFGDSPLIGYPSSYLNEPGFLGLKYIFKIRMCSRLDGVTIVTPNRYEYQEVKDVSGQSRIKFQVMACNDAHILLYQEDADPQNIQDNLIEIVIGKLFGD